MIVRKIGELALVFFYPFFSYLPVTAVGVCRGRGRGVSYGWQQNSKQQVLSSSTSLSSKSLSCSSCIGNDIAIKGSNVKSSTCILLKNCIGYASIVSELKSVEYWWRYVLSKSEVTGSCNRNILCIEDLDKSIKFIHKTHDAFSIQSFIFSIQFMEMKNDVESQDS